MQNTVLLWPEDQKWTQLSGFNEHGRTGNQAHGFSQVIPTILLVLSAGRLIQRPSFGNDDEKRKRAHLALQTDGLQLLAFDQIELSCKTNRGSVQKRGRTPGG